MTLPVTIFHLIAVDFAGAGREAWVQVVGDTVSRAFSVDGKSSLSLPQPLEHLRKLVRVFLQRRPFRSHLQISRGVHQLR